MSNFNKEAKNPRIDLVRSPIDGSDNPFDALTRSSASRVKQIWSVGGGKGGVGKSLVASSIAVSLSRLGNRVIAIDLDLGGANLHTSLGVELPKLTLTDFFNSRIDGLDQCVTASGIPNLGIISGAQDSIGVTNVRKEDKVRFFQKVRELDADYILFDLGAGTSFNTLDFFIFSDIGITTILPEPTSIENGYRFIKSVYYRRLWLSPKLSRARHLIESAMDPKNTLGIRTPADLYREVNHLHPETGMALKEEIEKIQPKLVVNQIRTQTDVDIGFSVKSVCKKYFGIELDYVGYLDYDSAVWQAVRRKRPLMLEFPNSRVVSSVDRMTNYLLKRYGHTRNSLF